MTNSEFEKLADAALKGLPPFFREKLSNIVVTVRAAPAPAQVRRFGRGLMGLYEGVPLLNRGTGYSGMMPDKITLFRKNIEAVGGNEAGIMGEVRHVVMHEIAHHFGTTDAELRRKGLY
ncbi:MAG: metallopeptidase family protein [Elusimicrobia bacterium]|nr:metallopeptidase family protein [Elusimicrobiota bacterium]